MAELIAILVAGVLMSAISLVGGLISLSLSEQNLRRLLLPMVAFSAGALIGGALFHMIPESLEHLGHGPRAFVWVAAGFAVFFCLEQFLHWHHCHRSTSDHHRPLTHLLLVADGLHNLIGGLAVGAAFLADFRLGVTTFLVAAAHEVPQEVGDFGVLVHGGWSPKKALIYNFASGLTFLIGGLIAFGLREAVPVAALIPFAAGNFLYIGAVDLVPEVNKHSELRVNILHFCCFAAGLGLLLAIAGFGHH